MTVQLAPVTVAEFTADGNKIQNAFRGIVAEKINAEASKVGVSNVAAHQGARRRLLSALRAPGGIDVVIVVDEISMAKSQTVAASLNTFFGDTTDTGAAAVFAKKPTMKITSIAVIDKASVEGPNTPKDGCQAHHLAEFARLKTENIAEAKWPSEIQSFCQKSFEKKKHLLKINKQIVERTCERARGEMVRVKEGERYKMATAEASGICYQMRHFFESMVRSAGGKNMTHGMATSVSDINRAAPGQGVSACCVPHMSAGCYDKAIQECVCTGNGKFKKKDDFCCNTEWDLTCTENVEWFHCAACPQPEFLQLRESAFGPATSPSRGPEAENEIAFDEVAEAGRVLLPWDL
jgi:hypothetical protein